VVVYRHLDGPPARLGVTPLLVARAPDAVQREDPNWRAAVQAVPGRVCIDLNGSGIALSLWHDGTFMPARVWQHGLVHPAGCEFARPGSLGRRREAPAAPEAEAALVPGYLECELPAGGAFHIVASIERELFRALAVEGSLGAPPPRTLGECVALLERGARDRLARWQRTARTGAEVTARQAAAAHAGKEAAGRSPSEPLPAADAVPLLDAVDPWFTRLAQALLDGLAEQAGRTTLLTTLPAGPERGADTLRALQALIALRAFGPARAVVRGYFEYLNEGLAPEAFEQGTQRPRYGDPAPALWLIHAAELLTRRSEDMVLLREAIFPGAESIVQAYRAGTRHGVHVADDGLLHAGEHGACRSDHNVLWFHALVATAQLARFAGRKESGAFYLAWAREHQGRVLETLWDEPHGCLLEAMTPEGPVHGLSPAQVLAVSLGPPLLTPDRATRMVGTIARELFTPLGLRPAPGAVVARPEWLGPFITAHLRVHQRSAEAHAEARGWLDTLRARLETRSAFHVPEVIAAPRHGDAAVRRPAVAPEPPPAQASVLAAAELLRVWIEELERREAEAGVGSA
jgi:hypothetical protein